MTPPSFVKVSTALLEIGLPHALVILYGRLRLHANRGGTCRVKHDTLAAEIGLKRRQLITLLMRLRSLGLIEWTRGNYVNSFRVLEPDFHKLAPDVHCSAHPDVQSDAHLYKKRSSTKEASVDTNGGRGKRGSGGEGNPAAAVSSPTTKKPPTMEQGPRREARAVAGAGSARPMATQGPKTPYPTSPGVRELIERPRPQKRPTDFWPHDPEKVAFVRSLLWDLGRHSRLGPPDDEIVRRVLDCGKGAEIKPLVDVIRHLFERKKFDRVNSWGLVPTIIELWFTSP